jgi:hypothetical protein
MLRSRSGWVRVLQLYAIDEDAADPAAAHIEDLLLDVRVHARSRFRSLVDPRRFAHYAVHNSEGAPCIPLVAGEHTLIAIREFRRVPLDASSLALTVFTARPGRAATVAAALAHFVERAVGLYQPGYVLVAHSREDPRTSLLLTAVRDAALLGAAASAAFTLDGLMPELAPLLAEPPESYDYCPEPEAVSAVGAVSPYAV